MYMDLPKVIQDISKSLPVNYKLYVKEHPSLYKYKVRPHSYYREINDLPNTVLIHPDVSSHELIQNAEITTTVTGTAGLEALIYKKPVITFGEPHYHQLSQVYNAGDAKELANIIQNILQDYRYSEEHDEELTHYLTAIFEYSYPTAKGRSGQEFDAAINEQCVKLEQPINEL
jgi:capsule polysaccharide export protein KpsC/LpsZ